MDLSDYRILLEDIQSRISDTSDPQDLVCRRFEALQDHLRTQTPEELPNSLQHSITASPQFRSERPFCDNDDFDDYGGWDTFFVQSKVLELYTNHDCENCQSSSLQGCLICLTWVAFSDLPITIESQTTQMCSTRINGLSSAVEGSAGPNGVSLMFQSPTQEFIGCSVKT